MTEPPAGDEVAVLRAPGASPALLLRRDSDRVAFREAEVAHGRQNAQRHVVEGHDGGHRRVVSNADLSSPHIRATVAPAPYDAHARTQYRRS